MNIQDKFSMKNKVSVITGAARGLGKAIATALAQAGSNIVIAEINVNDGKKTAKELEEKYFIESLVIKCDVTKPGQIKNMVAKTLEYFKKIDVLVNNAGICKHIKAEATSVKDWQSVINTNLNGVFYCSQEVGKIMIKQKYGNIINIASMSGIIVNIPQPQAAYNASKAAVIQLTKSLASEWAKYNIRVNAISPGYMKTEMTRNIFEEANEWSKKWISLTPMGRPGNPDELGGIALYLASEASSFTTGSTILVDGGYSIW